MSNRSELNGASRVVIKIGTGIINDSGKGPNLPRMTHIIRQIDDLCRQGKEVVIVSSGAVGVGRGVLGFSKKPKELQDLQACAAVGQSRLMAIYERLFGIYGREVGQVLLTHDDLENHDRYLNVRGTLISLLEHRIVPVINENDTVSVEELKFGDNDQLSALVAALIPADVLVLLTTVEGLMENFGTPEQRIIHTVENLDDSVCALAGGTRSDTATGGMRTKILSAKIATRSGIPMVIADGRGRDVLSRIFSGEEVGTLFEPEDQQLSGRKRWIAFCHHTRGAIIVDRGAKTALVQNGKSLLFPGIKFVSGEFEVGDVVSIRDDENREFARGITEISSGQFANHEIPEDEVVHRNNMVIL